MKSLALQILAVALISVILLGFGIERASIGTAYSDPVAKIRAQDESTYANMALRLVSSGDWLTPKVMGRYLLTKPPLLTWLAGLSLKVFGTSLFALRLPDLAAAVFSTVLLFSMAALGGSIVRAWITVALLLSNSLWHVFARLCYIDMLLVACVTGAIAILQRDPLLDRRGSLWGFVGCSAAAVMAKSIAGFIPLAILAIYWIIADRSRRPSPGRVALALGLTVALVAPWHLYQIFAHPKWFWADYVQVQLLGFGLNPPAQTSTESQIGFYAKRLILTDPVLCILLIAALPFLLREVRRRSSPTAALTLAWLAVAGGALLFFRYRNLPYALYFVPPACLAAGVFGPLFSNRWAKASAAVLVMVFGLKWYASEQPWGVKFGVAEPLPAAAALHSYYDLRRPNELIMVDTDDDLYAISLPLPRVRLCFLDPGDVVVRYAPHYAILGITLTADQFDHLYQLEPVYEARLKEWGLNSAEPIGSAIVMASRNDLLNIFRAHPDSDFYVSNADFELLERETAVAQTHQAFPATKDRAFLLARHCSLVSTAQPIRLPARW